MLWVALIITNVACENLGANHKYYEDGRWNRRSRFAFLLHGSAGHARAFRAAGRPPADISRGMVNTMLRAARGGALAAPRPSAVAEPRGGGTRRPDPTGIERRRAPPRGRAVVHARTCLTPLSPCWPGRRYPCRTRVPSAARHDVAVAVQQSAAGPQRAGDDGGHGGRRGRRRVVVVRVQPQPAAVLPVRGLLRRPVHSDMLPHVLREVRPVQEPGRQDQLSTVRVSISPISCRTTSVSVRCTHISARRDRERCGRPVKNTRPNVVVVSVVVVVVVVVHSRAGTRTGSALCGRRVLPGRGRRRGLRHPHVSATV